MKTFITLVEEQRDSLGLNKPSKAVEYGKAFGLNTNDQFWRNYRRQHIHTPHWAAKTIVQVLWHSDPEMGALVLATNRPSVVVHGTTAKIEQYARIVYGSVMDEVDVLSLEKIGMFHALDDGDIVWAPQRKNFRYTGVLLDRAMFDAGQVPVPVMGIKKDGESVMCDAVLTSESQIYAAIRYRDSDDQREALLSAARGYVVRL